MAKELNEFLDFKVELSSDYLLLKLKNKEYETRPRQDIVAVVDVSGSMISEANIKTNAGIQEFGLSVLDIVKHSLNTIIDSLNQNDRFSLVVYSYDGKVIFPLTKMTDEFKIDLKKQIAELIPDGATNLWDGLLKGMEEITKNDIGNNQSIILLTDGIPTEEPPRGYIETYKKYLKERETKFSLYNCGFGYNMNSELLLDLVKYTPYGGSYSFIPDSGMVGTIFINLMSNIFNQTANNLKIIIPKEYHPYLENIPKISHLTNSELNVMLKLKDNIDYKLLSDILVTITGEHVFYNYFEVSSVPSVINNNESFNFEKVRYNFIKCVEDLEFGVLDKLVSDLTESGLINNKIKILLEDYNGQVKEAIKPDYYKKWGKHYLPSLVLAHKQGICNNFKDPGVQNYIDDKFLEYQSKMEEIFTKLPPPKPSIQRRGRGMNIGGAGGFSMDSYYCSNNPCYAPECLVKMADGTSIPIGDLKQGMEVYTKYGPTKIKLVVISRVSNHHTFLCHFESGLKITPYHPIIYNKKWCYPCEVIHPVDTRTPVVISVVLEDYHIITVNEIETVTLGHKFKEDKVAHDFFGSEKVIEQLETHPTYETGEIILPEESILRDETNKVIGFKF